MDENVERAVESVARCLHANYLESAPVHAQLQTIRARLVELEAENERLRTHHAEIAEAVRKAARYDFLKSRAYIGVNRHTECLWTLRNIPEVGGKFDYDIDAAIDAQHNSAREGL